MSAAEDRVPRMAAAGAGPARHHAGTRNLRAVPTVSHPLLHEPEVARERAAEERDRLFQWYEDEQFDNYYHGMNR